jgi:hypothetical protein
LPSAMKPVEEQPDMADNLYSRWASRYPESLGGERRKRHD